MHTCNHDTSPLPWHKQQPPRAWILEAAPEAVKPKLGELGER